MDVDAADTADSKAAAVGDVKSLGDGTAEGAEGRPMEADVESSGDKVAAGENVERHPTVTEGKDTETRPVATGEMGGRPTAAKDMDSRPMATGDKTNLPAATEGAGTESSGGGGKPASGAESDKPAEPAVKQMKKIKPCPVTSSGRRRSPSPPPSPPGSPPPAPAIARSFSWDGLMRRPTFEATPVECFWHAPLSRTWRNVCPGLKAEVVHRGGAKGAPTTYWVATLLQVQGYRGLFRPEGLASDSSQDRWLEICSPEVKPVGWCAARGLPLTPPPEAGPAAEWQKKLVGVLTGARTLPPSFYRKVMSSISRCSQLSVGQTIEVVDKSCISQVRAARVTRLIGRRLHVHYLDGPEDDGGFWCHENSPLVHPVGWALAVGHRIEAPSDYLERCESGRFLPSEATEDRLPAPHAVTHEGFRVGMKLEALDPLNLGSIGVATVRQTLGNHFMMVRLETSPDSDWFCYHASSPYIFPAGFCRTVGIRLTPPYGYGSPRADEFEWEAYLRDEGATAAPAHLFRRPPLSHGFQPGHKLEAVDLMDPQLVCAATVAQVVGRLLRIHFDGWEEQFDQWADAESPDLFPVGWCALVGYPLEPPRPQERQPVRRTVRRRGAGRRGRPRLRGAGGGRPPRQDRREEEAEPPPPPPPPETAARLQLTSGPDSGTGPHRSGGATSPLPAETPAEAAPETAAPGDTSAANTAVTANRDPQISPEASKELSPTTLREMAPDVPAEAAPEAAPEATPEVTPEVTSPPGAASQSEPAPAAQPMEVCGESAAETAPAPATPADDAMET